MAQAEVEAIKQLLPTNQVIQTPAASSSLTVSSTLEHLPGVQVLHLACHGHQDQDDVLNSGFDLEDGRLTLNQLMRIDIPNAQLAYLSACETASTDETRPDESINLAATMMFVGFKSVIATMWYVDHLLHVLQRSIYEYEHVGPWMTLTGPSLRRESMAQFLKTADWI
jgi:CHAT domain-containing protein